MGGVAFIKRTRQPDKFQLSRGRPSFVPRYGHWLEREHEPECSYLIELISLYIKGFRPEGDRMLIDPLPTDLEPIELSNLPFRGKLYDLRIRKERIKRYCEYELLDHRRVPAEPSLER